MSQKRIAIFGSTGSIGKQTLEVIAANPDLFVAEILTAHANESLLIEQALLFEPNIVVIGEIGKYAIVKKALEGKPIKVFAGEEALEQVAAMDCYDFMMAGIVGFAGLKPTLTAVQNGKAVGLANKETLVVAAIRQKNTRRQWLCRVMTVQVKVAMTGSRTVWLGQKAAQQWVAHGRKKSRFAA